jgi:Tfp pilus assembly protein PilN
MASQQTINLVRSKASPQHELSEIDKSLRKSVYAAIIVFLCAAVITGSVYAVLSYENTILTSQKKTLLERVKKDIQLEAYYRSIKDRVQIVQSAMSNKRPCAQVLDSIASFVSPPVLTSINLGDSNTISISFRTSSLDTILSVVTSVINQTDQKHYADPTLVSLTIDKDGVYLSTISFKALF